MNTPITLAEEAASMLFESELSIMYTIVETTRVIFPNADLFVIKNHDKGRLVIRVGANLERKNKKSNNKVILSIGLPRNGKRPILSWGGQGTSSPKALASKIYQLKGIKKVFGTLKGVELGEIDSEALERYLEFLNKHRNNDLLLRGFNGNSISDLSFNKAVLLDSLPKQKPKSVLRKPSPDEIEAWLDEMTKIQKPLLDYLNKQKFSKSYQIVEEAQLDIGRIDIMLRPNIKSSELPQVIIELKFLEGKESKSVNRSKIRLAFGQLLDYSFNIEKKLSESRIERWLVINHLPEECKELFENLVKVDPEFSIWTFNENDENPFIKQIGESYFVFC